MAIGDPFPGPKSAIKASYILVDVCVLQVLTMVDIQSLSFLIVHIALSSFSVSTYVKYYQSADNISGFELSHFCMHQWFVAIAIVREYVF